VRALLVTGFGEETGWRGYALAGSGHAARAAL